MRPAPLSGVMVAKLHRAQGRGFEPRPMEVGHPTGPGEPVAQPASKVSVVGFCVVGEQDKEKKMIPSNFYPKVRLLAIVGGLALAACVLGFMATHKPADAAFPGGKGKIAFHSRHISGLQDSEIYTITADGKI